MFTWLPLYNLPPVPQHFVDELNNIHSKVERGGGFEDTKDKSNYQNRKLIVDGIEKPTRIYHAYDMGEEWKIWVKNNIIDNFYETGGRASYPESDMHGAHIDITRSKPHTIMWKINYFTELSGPGVITTFYKEKGQSIFRTADQPYTVDDYSKLEVIEQVEFPANTWIVLNTGILHGVENMGNAARRYFTIMIDPEEIKFKLDV